MEQASTEKAAFYARLLDHHRSPCYGPFTMWLSRQTAEKLAIDLGYDTVQELVEAASKKGSIIRVMGSNCEFEDP